MYSVTGTLVEENMNKKLTQKK